MFCGFCFKHFPLQPPNRFYLLSTKLSALVIPNPLPTASSLLSKSQLHMPLSLQAALSSLIWLSPGAWGLCFGNWNWVWQGRQWKGAPGHKRSLTHIPPAFLKAELKQMNIEGMCNVWIKNYLKKINYWLIFIFITQKAKYEITKCTYFIRCAIK